MKMELWNKAHSGAVYHYTQTAEREKKRGGDRARDGGEIDMCVVRNQRN